MRGWLPSAIVIQPFRRVHGRSATGYYLSARFMRPKAKFHAPERQQAQDDRAAFC
jgi:hypothetical protein